MKIKIAPSMMCVNFLRMEDDLKVLDEKKTDYLHFDIMDGSFVPNFTLGPGLMNTCREVTDIPFDVHLMIDDPDKHVQSFAEACGDNPDSILVVHAEASKHINRTLSYIRSFGVRAGVGLNPETPLSTIDYCIENTDMVLLMTVDPGYAGQKLIPSTLNKIKDLHTMLDKRGLLNKVEIEVDGNVSFENIPKMTKNGANVLVCGTSSLFSKDMDLATSYDKLLEACK